MAPKIGAIFGAISHLILYTFYRIPSPDLHEKWLGIYYLWGNRIRYSYHNTIISKLFTNRIIFYE